MASLRRFCLVLSLLFPVVALLGLTSGHTAQRPAAAVPAVKRPAAESVPGEILVRFRSDAAAEKERAAGLRVQTAGRDVPVQLESLAAPDLVAGLRLARVEPEALEATIAALNARADVLYAEPNYIWRKLATPNDPSFGAMANLRNNTYPTADIDAEQAWDITTGSRNVVVGVIDEGIDINHVDLHDNIWTNPAEVAGNGIDDDGDGLVDDVHGWDFFHNDASVYDGPGTNSDGSLVDAHGTHVAGILGATGNNGVGVVGVNWQVSILPLKFLGPNGGSTADAIRAYDYARSLRALWLSSNGTKGANIRVLNNSYGGSGRSQAALDAISALGDAGILFVVAAGNDARDNDRFPVYPADYRAPNLVSVASADVTGLPSSEFSNYGQRTVDLIAPGENILSTTPGDTYDRYYGTSMAAPHAAGVAALVCAAQPDITMNRLRAALVYGGAPGIVNFTSSGRRVNAYTSLQNAAELDTTAPAMPANLRIINHNNQTYTLQWNAPGDDNTSGIAAIYEIRYADADLNNETQFAQAYLLPAPLPQTAGAQQTATVNVPFRHANGFIGVRAVDNAGNASPVAEVGINADPAVADPYIVSETANEPLSTGGTPLNFHADDQYVTYQLPFQFTFFGRSTGGVAVSSNGALHFSFPAQLPNGLPDVDVSHTEYLPARQIIAGVWDDLRTDRRAGDDVYVVQPDLTRIIFRWQAVTYDTPIAPGTTRGENPVNFEIELRRDGTIITRYGDGNHNLLPVVGASGGEPDPYLVASHTSDTALKDLTNAQTITYTPRRPTPLPSPDLAVGMRVQPDLVASGQRLIYLLDVANQSTEVADQTVVVDQLPAGTSFITCTTTHGTCTGPSPSSDGGTVTANLGALLPITSTTVTIEVQVNAPPGSTLSNTASISSYWADSNPANNTATTTKTVQAAAIFNGVRAISAGNGDGNSSHTLALKTDGTVWAWGYDIFSELGDNTQTINSSTPVQALGLTNVAAIDAGGEHSLALKTDGTVWAWGQNQYGEAGAYEQFFFIKPVPERVAGLSQMTAIAAGNFYSLALRADGTVWGWGAAGSGQLGNGVNGQPVYTPVQVLGLTDVKAIAAGNETSAAVKTDGTVWAWGANLHGELGANASGAFSRNTPVQVSGITGASVVSVGSSHVVALKTDGTVWTWGDNSQGQLGSNTASGSQPRQVTGLTGVASVVAGNSHTIALRNDGTVWTWGSNGYGQLGDGTTTNRNVPVQVSGLTNVVAVSAGAEDSAALLADGTIRMWGRNDTGQLGDRTTVAHSSPIQTSGIYPVATPVFSPDGGTFTNGLQGVFLGSPTPGSVIHYTTNGNDPTEDDTIMFNGAFMTLSQTVTIKARAYKVGWPASSVKSATFTFPNATPTPTPTPVSGATTQPIIYSVSSQTGADLFIQNTDGTGRVNLTNVQGDDYAPAWSPDGTKIAFVTYRGGLTSGKTKIAVMNADGTGFRVLSETGTDDFTPTWSPDGTRIAFASVGGLFVINADGTGRKQISSARGSYLGPSWSPDGQRIAYSFSTGTESDIWVTSLNGDSPVQLTSGANYFDPAWSPDGTRIAFDSTRDDASNTDIYVMSADGSNIVRLTNNAAVDRDPAWSPDGTKIVFDTTRDNVMGSAIYVMNADGSNQTSLGTGFNPDWRGARATLPALQFSNTAYTVAEDAGNAVITVTRTGDTASAVTVAYRTVDTDTFTVGCADTVNNHGGAYARCDFATVVGTLQFAAGETTKTFTVPVIDDAYVEGDETFQIALTNSTGASLGTPATATVTILDNDSTGATNPISSNAFFVRQQYLDFLSREPDTGGFNAWLGVLNNCANVNNDPSCDRILVSQSFFGSPEFQLKGFYVFRFYRLAFNRLPDYTEIVSDMSFVAGATADEVFARKAKLAQSFTQRAEFANIYGRLANADYVSALLGRYQLTQVTTLDPANPDGAQKVALTATDLVNKLNSNTLTRAQVFRAIADSDQVGTAEFNNAFVGMQYYGYLRRTPEPTGYNAWLTYLTAHPTDFRTMVNGFMNSAEYRLRFGQP